MYNPGPTLARGVYSVSLERPKLAAVMALKEKYPAKKKSNRNKKCKLPF